MKARRTGLDAWRLWLLPGMGVKRHVALAVLGGLVMVLGVIGAVLWWFNERRETLAQPIESVLVSTPWRQMGGWTSLVLVVAGIAIATAAVGRLNRSLLSNWMPRPQDAAELLYRRVTLGRGPKVVILGGGTGTSNLLRGLREHTSNLTAVVAVSDDGGSSGRLRRAFDMPAPGDLTDCLAALSNRESSLSRLLQHRFERGDELRGHTFGNLLITTLREFEGDFGQALRVLNELLDLSGAVYPATTEPVTLEVTKRDGTVVRGESAVREVDGPVRSVALVPSSPTTLPEVELAILEADLIVLGPGSLFTSTIPPLLVPGVRSALARAGGSVVYVANIMTEAGETDGLDAFDHVAALMEHGARRPDLVVVNETALDERRLRAYAAERAEPVRFARRRFEDAGIAVETLPLLCEGDLAQHDSALLARALVRIAREARAQAAAEQRPPLLGAHT
ncbi:MAG TPA: uridine diphosphate-N-acetylglucosamine-binding protein YvcK [Trueperaceae bacterium]|jgi:uncharacterized cofD-like protein